MQAVVGQMQMVTLGPSTSCGRCHRALRNLDSRKRGLGPVCAAKLARAEARRETEEAVRTEEH